VRGYLRGQKGRHLLSESDMEICSSIGCCYMNQHYRVSIEYSPPCGILHPLEWDCGWVSREAVELHEQAVSPEVALALAFWGE